uniref:Spaetzle domain-containing protein n=1 Tax=Anopheles dirus TaxID=7168 RepID=A0A182N0S0_9DIPT
MASLRTGLVILFTFLYFVTLHADKPTYGPLVRPRSIARQQTSEEELNTTIGSIYQRDFKTTPATKGWHDDDKRTGRPPLELETRSSAGGSSGRRQPISPDDQSKSQQSVVIRQSDGSLTVSFATTTSWQPPTTTAYPYVPVATVAPNPLKDEILVLRVAQNDSVETVMDKEGTAFFLNSYPSNYPFKKIEKIMQEKSNLYEDLFERSVKRDNLETRINSPSDQYLCASERRYEYPTFHPHQKGNIVNVPGFFQEVTIETCANEGFSCSNSNTDSDHELVCEQVYGEYTLYTVPVGDHTRLTREPLRFPSCCKCKHVPKGTGRK